MRIAVVGLWHLGLVTTAALASVGHEIIALDESTLIENLKKGKTPIAEPGLDALLAEGLQQKKIRYTDRLEDIKDADIVWVTYDTPVDENDNADVRFVQNKIKALFPFFKEGALIIISSQLPVGSVRALIKAYPDKKAHFACSPENLRLGKALEVFLHPDRVIMGLESPEDQAKVKQLFSPITTNILFMSLESAEMVKHAINSFLALSVTFINEVATLCQSVGANPHEVEQGLKSETRIGPKAYLKPGSAFAGGTLARDVNYLIKISEDAQEESRLFPAILASNHQHKFWAGCSVLHVLKNLSGKQISLLGLTYKPGTNTLRRSSAIELAEWLHKKGARIKAYDPLVKELPEELASFIHLDLDISAAFNEADALILCTEWPEFKELPANALKRMRTPLIFDINGFCEKNLGQDPDIQYFKLGKAYES